VFGKRGRELPINDDELSNVTSCLPGLDAARVTLLIKPPASSDVELVLISSADGKMSVVFDGKMSVVFDGKMSVVFDGKMSVELASPSVSIEGDDPCVLFDMLVLFACESEGTVGTLV
jgi:hypothetical protein